MEYPVARHDLSPAARLGLLVGLAIVGILVILFSVLVGWPAYFHSAASGSPALGMILAGVGVLLLAAGAAAQFATRVRAVEVGASGLTIFLTNRPDRVFAWSDPDLDVRVSRKVSPRSSGASAESYLLEPEENRSYGLEIAIPFECYQETLARAKAAGCSVEPSTYHERSTSTAVYYSRITRPSVVAPPQA